MASLARIAVFGLFGLAAPTVLALCNQTLNGLGPCVSCRSAFTFSYYSSPTLGCVACGGACILFRIAEGDEGSSETLYVPDASYTGYLLSVASPQILDIASRNPWAAATLIALRELGSTAELRNGTTVLSVMPTEDSVRTLLDGNRMLAQSLAIPIEVRGRVLYRLERGPGPRAALHMSSVVVDDAGRLQFKAYPDIVVSFAEGDDSAQRDPSSGVHTELRDAPSLIATSWRVQ